MPQVCVKPRLHEQLFVKIIYNKGFAHINGQKVFYDKFSMINEDCSCKRTANNFGKCSRSNQENSKTMRTMEWSGLDLSTSCQMHLSYRLHEQIFIWQLWLFVQRIWHGSLWANAFTIEKIVIWSSL